MRLTIRRGAFRLSVLAALATLAAGVPHGALAQAASGVLDPSMLTPQAGSSAWRWIVSFFPEILGGPGNTSTVLGEVLRSFNAILLSVGAAFVTLNIVTGTMNTAQDGEVLGKRWSSMWAPIRTIVGMALMVPLSSGYASIQVVVLTVVKWSIGLADTIWSVAISALILNGASLVQTAPPKVDEFIGGVVASLLFLQTR